MKVRESVAGSIAKTGALLVVLAGTIAVWAFGLDSSASVKIVGAIPAGFEGFSVPVF